MRDGKEEISLKFICLDTSVQTAIISAMAGLLGAIIGALATLVPFWVKQHGKVSLFARIVYDQDGKKTIGFYKSNHKVGLVFWVPMWLEISNTSGEPKIVRNVSLCACLNETEIGIFEQIQRSQNHVYGNDQAYSFVIPPYSICRYNLLFMLHEADMDPNNNTFNRLIMEYSDNKNRIHRFQLIDIEHCWVYGELPHKREWISLKNPRIGE